ncbi:MAG: hypothetical protein ACK47B_27895 [Armatimonadota bacterium]
MRWILSVGLIVGLMAGVGSAEGTAAPPAAQKSSLVFADGGSIWTIAADGTNRRRLTPTGTDTAPAWSRDGKQIAFIRGGDRPRGVLYTIDSSGGQPRKLVGETCWSPLWSPIRDEIAYVRSQDEGEPPGTYIGFVDSLGQPTRKPVLHVLDSGTLHSSSTGELCDWSPDGTRLSVLLHGYLFFDVETLRLTPGEVERRTLYSHQTAARGFQSLVSHAWSPSGEDRDLLVRYVFKRDSSAECDLSVGQVGSFDRTMVSRPKLGRQGTLPLRASWSPDGKQIAYESEGRIFLTNVEKPMPRPLTTGSHPRWRPG